MLPDVWSACGVELRPFTLGHALLLTRLGSPLIAVEGATELPSIGLGDVLVAAWVCSRPARQAIVDLDSHWQMLWLRWKRLTRASMMAADQLALLKYINAAYQAPPIKVLQQREGEGRGAPWLAILFVGMVSHCGCTAEEALDTPLATAQWLHALRLEESGVLRIETLDDQAHGAAADQLRRQAAEDPAAVLALVNELTGKPA